MSKKKKGAFGKKAFRPRGGFANSPSSRQLCKPETPANYQPKINSGNMMQELARNTRNQTAHWDQGTRLRDQPVRFISGGFIEPSTELKCDATFTLHATEHASYHSENVDGNVAKSCTPKLPMPHALSYVDIDVNSSSDVKKDKSVTDSDSNREIILFKGRGNRHKARRGSKWRGRNRPATSPKPSNASAREPIESDDDEGTNAAMDDYISNILLDEMQQTQQDQVEIPENFDNGIPGTHISEPKPGRVSPVGTDANSDETDNEDSDGQTWGLSATMDDSQLARLLAKQEELGLGSGELLLLDGDSIAGGDQGMIGRRDRKASAKKRSTPMDTLKKNFATVGGSYPSAEAVADAFERLNMSGWGGARDGLELNLSDSELEVQLRMSWQKDRQRKKEKKRAREELRSKGLLRKDANSNDPRVKYPDGMHMDDIKTEFFNFLNGTETSISFTPMASHSRKIIHELAHHFNITSKSTGSGDQRRPTLSRKKSTATYDEDVFQSIFGRIQGRYMPRLDDKKSFTGAARRGHAAAAVVRHGEIVGGSAPEIGQTNKGRTMLEKMGWSRGMALGAMDNKGMTQPIEHVVIRSKAGLG